MQRFQLGPFLGLGGADEGEGFVGEEVVGQVVGGFVQGLESADEECGFDGGFERRFVVSLVHTAPVVDRPSSLAKCLKATNRNGTQNSLNLLLPSL